MKRAYAVTLSTACTAALLAGCTQPQSNARSAAGSAEAIVFFSVTHDGADDPQRLDMAMKLAGFSLDEDRRVVMFFNVRGVRVPTQAFSDTLSFKDDKTIKAQLASLIDRGAEVHVCPICMKALDVQEGDLVEGAQVTTRPKLFSTIGPGTTVFTY